jgi:signal transduction histidine kinase/ActR/RegA family two-component response regulator
MMQRPAIVKGISPDGSFRAPERKEVVFEGKRCIDQPLMLRADTLGRPWKRLSPAAIVTAVIVGAVIVSLAWLLDVRLRMEERSSLVREQERAVADQKLVLRSELNELTGAANAMALTASTLMQGHNREIADERLRGEFLNFARSRQALDQLRLVSLEGRELVNIKRIRTKTGSGYFRDTTADTPRDLAEDAGMTGIFSLTPGRVFSSLEWKTEEGSRAVRAPILRVGVPVLADQGRQVIGYVVVDFLAAGLFQKMARIDAQLDATTYVATPDGQLVRGPGGITVSGMNAVDTMFPAAWKQISRLPSGAFQSADGSVVFDSLVLNGVSDESGSDPQQVWKLFTAESPKVIASREKKATAPVLGWGILALCLFVPLSCLIVTDREQKREAFRAKEQTGALLQSIADCSVDGIVAGEAVRGADGDIHDFRTIFINPAAVYILKSFDRREAAEGREFPLFFSSDFLARCVQVVVTGTRYETEQSTECTPLGTRWFRVVVVRLNDGVVLSFSDITEQKLVMHELRLAKDAAEVANRAKSQFLTMMGHEIRTPMNGLLGFASLLERTDLSDEQRDYVTTLRLSGEALLRILEDILDYSHMENEALNMKNQPVAVKELIKQVSQLFVMAIGDRKLELVARIAPDVPPQILGDDLRLRQILVNIIGNAVKFTEEGFILIKVVRETCSKGDFVVFHVVDSGSGIPPEMIDRLFKPFSQVEAGSSRRYGGTGLGLSICRRLVETMGGEIGVRTAPDKGSDFYFSIPIKLPDFPDDSPVPAAKRVRADFRKPRILVVDDDSVNRKLIMRMIEKAGAEAQLVESGSQAIHAFQEEEFDLIIMDIQMPGMDGIETTRRIREIEMRTGAIRRTPISALTANAGEGDRERCFEAGMDDFFCKPIRIDVLEKLIEKNTA